VAEVNRAVAAGDVFFELGQYDLAVRAYQGPLKLDPNNKLLRSKIDRALKAKAAEQQFLGQ
jgi:tetratricopeptide (TPR) repeat protein